MARALRSTRATVRCQAGAIEGISVRPSARDETRYPIVLMSGYFSETAWKRNSEVFGGFIRKPIDRVILIRIIQRLLVKNTAKSHGPTNPNS